MALVMGRGSRLRRLALVIGATAIALTGCGGSGEESPSETKVLPLQSPAIATNGVIRSSYRCGGGSLWVPLDWATVPPSTKELAIYIGRFKYVKSSGGRKLVVPFADLVSQIEPSLRHLPANTIPTGATWSNFGPVSCPNREGQNVLLQVFALDRAQRGRQMRSRLATRLTKEALARQPNAEPRSPGKLTGDAVAVGQLITTYGPSPARQSG